MPDRSPRRNRSPLLLAAACAVPLSLSTAWAQQANANRVLEISGSGVADRCEKRPVIGMPFTVEAAVFVLEDLEDRHYGIPGGAKDVAQTQLGLEQPPGLYLNQRTGLHGGYRDGTTWLNGDAEDGLAGLWSFTDAANPGRDASPGAHHGVVSGLPQVSPGQINSAGRTRERSHVSATVADEAGRPLPRASVVLTTTQGNEYRRPPPPQWRSRPHSPKGNVFRGRSSRRNPLTHSQPTLIPPCKRSSSSSSSSSSFSSSSSKSSDPRRPREFEDENE